MKKILSLLMACSLMFTMAACAAKAPEPAPVDPAAPTPSTEAPAETPAPESAAGSKIGVAMPTKDLQRWNQDGQNMKTQLEAAGFTVDLQYANNDPAIQASQIENMLTGGCKALVIASIDGKALGTALAQAKEASVPVIAYDRLIMDSDAISYYATFDNYMVGSIQGKFIKDKLDLDNAAGPFNIELFAGSPDDNNARFFNQGAMDVLKPFIDSGKLVVVSGQTEFEKIAIPAWKSETAQARMDNLITAHYATGKKLDAVLSPNDSLAIGIVNSLDSAGYGTADKPYPVITGQDCDVTSVKNIIAGKQSMSIFKDTRTLAAKVVEMVSAVMNGTEVAVNDTETYDNGKGIVPTYLCEPVFASIDNYKEILIDSGYYTEDQVK